MSTTRDPRVACRAHPYYAEFSRAGAAIRPGVEIYHTITPPPVVLR